MSEIRIDAPGAGEWVMSRVTGVFTPGWDHSFTVHDGDQILGGFVLCHYLGASATIHVAGVEGENWCSRELLWMVFDYGFNQLNCQKLIAPIKSTNFKSLSVSLRAGWTVEAIIRDVYPDAHMFILTMLKETCPWLDYKPQHWRSGSEDKETPNGG